MAGTFNLACHHDAMPAWANDAFSVFENQHGEQWLAVMRDGDLVIAGGDYDWQDLVVTKAELTEEVRAADAANETGMVQVRTPSILKQVAFDPAELVWLRAVLVVACQRTASDLARAGAR